MGRYLTRFVDENGFVGGAFLAAGLAGAAALLYLAVTQPAGVYEEALLALAVATFGAMLAYPVLDRPVLGLAVLAPAAILPAITVAPGTVSSFAYLAAPLVFASWLLSRLSSDGGMRFLRSPAFRPLGCLMLVVIIASVVGQYRWFGVQGASTIARLGGLGVFLSSAAVFVVAAHEMRNVRWLRRSVWALLLVGAALLISALLTALGFESMELAGEERGVGSMFWTWLMAMAFSQGLINEHLSLPLRALCLSIVGGALALTMGAWMDWASGWAPGCLAIGVTLLLYRPRTALVAGVVVGVAILANATVARDMAWSEDQAYSTHTRAAAAETLFQIAKENPVTGFGPANYYHYTPLFPILGWYVHFSSHNNYFDLVLQTGLLGLLCVWWLWFELGRLSWKARRTVRPGFEAAYLFGAMGGLVGTAAAGALGDWFLPFVYNVGLEGFGSSILAWLFLGGLVAVASLRGRAYLEADEA